MRLADTFLSRFIGLQFRREFPAGEALMLAPCSSVHTMWVRFPIDVAMIGPMGEVLDVHRGVRPWTLALIGPKGTRAVLEFPGRACPLVRGDRIRLAPGTGGAPQALPKSLRFLHT